MKICSSFLFTLLILFSACGNKRNVEQPIKALEEVALSFLSWFKNNSTTLIINKAIQPDPTSPDKNYWVNKTVLKDGMEEIRSTNFFTENYLNNFEAQFIEVEKILKVKPQNDGPAPGMNKLLFLNAQDVGDVWTGLAENKYEVKQKVSTKNLTSFTIYFGAGYPVRFKLIKQDNVWQIDEIK